jgi:hypothetical protein
MLSKLFARGNAKMYIFVSCKNLKNHAMGQRFLKNAWLVTLGLVMMLGLNGCYDNTPEFKVDFTVKSLDNIPIQNAVIRVFAPDETGAPTFEEYLYTGEDGRASFSYPWKAFFEVHVQKGSFRTCTYVELIENETVQKTIFIRPFGDPNSGCPVN